MADIKWSAFPSGGTMVTGDQLVGLRSGANTRLTPVIPAQVQQSAFNFASLGGSSNAFTVSLSPTIAALTDGMIVTFYSGAQSNTIAAPTLSVDGLTAVTIVCWSGGLAPNDITTNTEYLCIYNLTDNVFQLVNPSISTANTFEVQSNDYNYATDTGVANAYIANIQPAQLTNNSGLFVVMTAINANTAASTLTVNGVTHPILLSNGIGLTGGEILVNGIYQFIYSNYFMAFILINSSAVASLSPTQNQIGFVGTGGGPDDYPIIQAFNESAYILNVFYPNILGFSWQNFGLQNYTTIDMGNLSFTTGNLSLTGSNLTSFIANKVLVVGNLLLAAPNLITTSFSSLIIAIGGISLGFSGIPLLITSISFPALKQTVGITFTNCPNLTSFSASNVIDIFGAISGTANALTTFSLNNTKYLTSWTLTSNLLTTISMPSMTIIAGAFTPVANLLSTIDFTSLVTIQGALNPTLPALTTLTLTNLNTITGAFGLIASALTTLSLPALVTMSSTWSTTMALVTTATFTNLQTVTGAVTASFAALATLNFPAIITFGAAVTFTAANLVTFSFGSTLKSVGGNLTMSGMKLNQASVDGILVSLAALDGTGGTTAYSSKTVLLNGGTSSAPSATGLAAKVTLVGRGCTVTTN